MKILSVMFEIDFDTPDRTTTLQLGDKPTIKGLVEEIFDGNSGEFTIGDRARANNPELVRELEERLRIIRDLQRAARSTLLPVLRKVARATKKAERDMEKERNRG